MKKICNYNRKKILLFILFLALFLFLSIKLLIDDDDFALNFLIKGRVVRFMGFIGAFTIGIAIIWPIVLLMRKNPALIITDDYLIENIRYKSLGKIYYSEISGIKIFYRYAIDQGLFSRVFIERKKIKYLKITLKNPIETRLNFIDKFYLKFFQMEDEFENNIYINSGLLKDCDLDELKKIISSNIKKGRRK